MLHLQGESSIVVLSYHPGLSAGCVLWVGVPDSGQYVFRMLMLLSPDTPQSPNSKPFKNYSKCISLLLTKSHLFHLNPRTTEDERLLIRATPGDFGKPCRWS